MEEVGDRTLTERARVGPAQSERRDVGRPLRLLFHYPVLNRGGAERSMLRLMSALVARGCEVHLVLTSAGGELESEVDPGVRVHHLRTFQTWREGSVEGPRQALARSLALGRLASARLQEWWRRREFRDLSFDAAIAGLAGLSPDFICHGVVARRRFVFVRNDPAVDSRGRWAARIHKYQELIDDYVCVSAYVHKAMASRFPSIVKKLVTIHNLLNPEEMRAKADAGGNPFSSSQTIRVLSVCRLQESSKALVRMVEVHRRLLDAGVTHEWHVLGDGPDRWLLEQAIAKHGVADSFRLHGAVSNPFPYYKHADICAVLSRFEGLSGVVNEARVLERAVVATRFAGVDEQIESGVNGLIVEQDLDEICAGMASLICDQNFRERMALGGYPRQLLDDGAKVDALMQLFGGGRGLVGDAFSHAN